MDEQTLTALQGSIKKWERVVNGGGDHGWQDCPLCDLFYFQNREDECDGCPVAARAGKPACSGTPYTAWVKYAWKPDRGDGMVFDEKSKQLAQAELDFLKSLLPSDAAGERKE